MNSHTRHLFIRAAGVVALALWLTIPAARAEIARIGTESWYQQSTADARLRAQALFEQAVDKHQLLLREDAMELYEQALALWDNPDIRWNLALVLEDLGQYLRAHQELERALRWGEALGAERLRDMRDRMRGLETQHLARIKTSSDEPGADIKFDGQPWFRGAGNLSTLVTPGEHYISASKEGYFPVNRSVSVTAGKEVRVALPMDADRVIETRRWSSWKPWVVVSAGVVVTAVGVGLERQAFVHRDAAAAALGGTCKSPLGCPPAGSPDIYDRAVRDGRLAIAAYLTGGTTVVVGLTLAWLNQLQAHRTEPRAPAPIELTPLVSQNEAGLSVQLRF